MCRSCWEEVGSPTEVDAAKIDRFRSLHDAVYDQPNGGAGGGLHIVLDDMNLGNEPIQWCLDQELNKAERECAEFLLTLTTEERYAAYAKMEGWC